MQSKGKVNKSLFSLNHDITPSTFTAILAQRDKLCKANKKAQKKTLTAPQALQRIEELQTFFGYSDEISKQLNSIYDAALHKVAEKPKQLKITDMFRK